MEQVEEADEPSLGRFKSPRQVLEEADWRLWLRENAGHPARLLRPGAPDGTLQAWPVSPRVNSPRTNDASLIEPMRMAAEGGGPNPA
jgi:putative SOS response-associated peptidase YedK